MTLPSIKFQSRATAAQANVPVTFGHVFAPGDLMAGRGMIARAADGSYLPLQIDQKATHADGSIRHAIISCILPTLAAATTGEDGTVYYDRLSLQLLDADKRSAVQTFAGAPASVAITLAGVAYTATIDPAATFALWLTGPVVNEHQFNVPFTAADGTKHPHLMARFAVRDYGSAQRVDVTVENCWAFEPGPTNFPYDIAVTVDGQVVYSKTALTHIHHARWRKVFWTGAAPAVSVQHDMQYLASTMAVSNYDPSFKPAEGLLQSFAAGLMGAASEPMGIGIAMAYMPTTGAHPDLGILPDWSVAWLLSMDSRARDASLITGDGAGSFSIHYRDQITDRPVSIKNFPHMTVLGQSSDTFNPLTGKYEAFPALVGDVGSPYGADTAHQPSLAFLPYLLTGDFYYLEEMQFWASFNLFKSNPNYRLFDKGCMIDGELRDQAWGLRTLFHVAAFTPDSDPTKADWLEFVDNNLDWYSTNYPLNPNFTQMSYTEGVNNNLGVPTHYFSVAYNNGTAISTWMHDFFVSVLGYGYGLGFTKAKPMLDWAGRFQVARMTEVCWPMGAPYELTIRDDNGKTVYPTVADCYAKTPATAAAAALPCMSDEFNAAWKASFGGTGQAGDMANIAEGNTGYRANMQPGLAAAVDAGLPGAQLAWDRFMSSVVKPDFSYGSQFSILPRNYTAQPVSIVVPASPVDTSDWQQIAVEGATVTVPTDTTVRYGAAGRFIEKIVSGAVTADNATFGDPAPNTAKVLQQLIPSTEGNPMTHKLSITGIKFADQNLAFGTEAATSLLVELLDPNGAVLGSTATIPGDINGITFSDLTAKHTIRASGKNTAGVMGVPALQDFVPQDYLPVVTAPTDPVPPVDPTPTTAVYSLPSAVTFTLAAE